LSKRYEEADVEFEEAIRLNVNLFEAFYFFGRNCYAQGRVEKACHMFEEARRASPQDRQVPFLLAMTYRDLNRPAEADTEIRRGMALVEKHIELNPDDSRAWILGASGLAELGEAEDAIEWAKKALSIDPNNPITFYVAACMYSRIGQSERALDCLEKVMSIGSVYREWIERDSDLESLRKHPRYRALINKGQ
jgi:tetratricopeptide (TPR) repeat protein